MLPAFYAFTSPLLVRGLSILSGYMDKAAAHVAENGIDPAVLINARLASDMMPLSGQVQRASDKAKNGIARLAGISAPAFADTETSFEELKDRLGRTMAFIETVPSPLLEAAAERRVEFRFPGVTGPMNGHAYLTKFLLPDFYLHIAIAHGILRHHGLEIGKVDYLGKP